MRSTVAVKLLPLVLGVSLIRWIESASSKTGSSDILALSPCSPTLSVVLREFDLAPRLKKTSRP